ncbi:ProQ/FINO family protein [Ruegeria sp.]|uniref:ProQ/FINO family protein n=1 Tax=Ruegeria sp. TaxID=1879320 RepID=UPI003AFFA867
MKKTMTKRAPKPRISRAKTPREQMHLRCFPERRRRTILQTLRYALRLKPADALPKVFQLPVAVALTPGSPEELATRFNVPRDSANPYRVAFESALALYCRSPQYGHALLHCEHLFTIDMDPAETPDRTDRDRGRELAGLPPRRPRRPERTRAGGNSGARHKEGPPSGAQKPSEQTPPAATTRTQDTGPDAGRPPRRAPQEMQKLFPEQRDRLIGGFCRALSIEPGSDALPAFLRESRAIPLKIGSYDDLVDRFGLAQDADGKRKLHQAFRSYCRTTQYLRAIANTKTRFTVDMEPAEPIEEEYRQDAIRQLRQRSEDRKQKNAQNAPPAAPETPTDTPPETAS